MAASTLRTEDHGTVRTVVLIRAEELNTITPLLRRELDEVLETAERDASVKVLVLRAEGSAFCAGFGLDWATASAADEEGQTRVWDPVADLDMIGTYADTFSKLHTISKPTIAAVHGWCVAGGTDLAFNSDLIICGESARFGHPPARVWGIPEQPWLWVARLGLQAARRYLFTGDEITAAEAERLGLVWQRVPDSALQSTVMTLAQRIGQLPLSQLRMMKLVLNDVAHRAYDPRTSRLLGCVFDGLPGTTEKASSSWPARRRSAGDKWFATVTPPFRTMASGHGWMPQLPRTCNGQSARQADLQSNAPLETMRHAGIVQWCATSAGRSPRDRSPSD